MKSWDSGCQSNSDELPPKLQIKRSREMLHDCVLYTFTIDSDIDISNTGGRRRETRAGGRSNLSDDWSVCCSVSPGGRFRQWVAWMWRPFTRLWSRCYATSFNWCAPCFSWLQATHTCTHTHTHTRARADSDRRSRCPKSTSWSSWHHCRWPGSAITLWHYFWLNRFIIVRVVVTVFANV